MDKVIFILILGLFFTCKKEERFVFQKAKDPEPKVVEKIQEDDSVAFFDKALVYQYQLNNKEEELWIYVNEKKKQLLFAPDDDMIQAVISYADGTYKILGTEHDGKKTIMLQTIRAVTGLELDDSVLKKNTKSRIISQKNIQQKDIHCEGFSLKYLKTEGGETLFSTSQIPINSFQLYGFSRLEGDCKLLISLDYINIFKKDQLLTHIERNDFKLELINYGPNPYEINLTEYMESQ